VTVAPTRAAPDEFSAPLDGFSAPLDGFSALLGRFSALPGGFSALLAGFSALLAGFTAPLDGLTAPLDGFTAAGVATRAEAAHPYKPASAAPVAAPAALSIVLRDLSMIVRALHYGNGFIYGLIRPRPRTFT
jgi:hypothetical protein